jgi:hypothetical protein
MKVRVLVLAFVVVQKQRTKGSGWSSPDLVDNLV